MFRYWDVLITSVRFSGRMRCKSYGLFLVVLFILVCDVLWGMSDGHVVRWYVLVTLPVLFSSSCRRLHDAGYSGWRMWIGVIPVVGMIGLIYSLFKKGQPYHNRFEPNPREWEDR
ncbi:DUF805 domain-containing protein [Vibrio sp. ER1A]|uniref:DUF805 domain-containing protein n=1 Tax=Vibrio sp. ER1A TaxID=1517681 RepID=UPI0009DCCB93|nr:DUF805 domain-containing protein [Vibrio sp. ER1A]